jgi:putative PIN family toxin of toxin-antitoxin system
VDPQARREAEEVKHAPRAVLDTNIVLSALLFAGGRLAPIRLGWQQAVFRPLVSRETAAELIRALGYPKFRLSETDRDELLGDYLPHCTVVKMPAEPPAVPHCRDPFDLPFLQLATHGKAGYLVTGDRDLLALQGQLRCEIVTADAFLSAVHRR